MARDLNINLPALLRAFLLVALLLPAAGNAATLRYRVEGADDALRQNIRAYLGASPQSTEAAERFLVAAPSRAVRAMEALGFYAPPPKITVDRSVDPWRAVITVEPGEALHYTAIDFRLEGAAAGDDAFASLRERLLPAVGDVVHHGRYETLKAELQQLARQRGYFDAMFTSKRIAVDVAERSAILDLQFDSGRRYRFGRVSGDEDLLADEVLANLLPFEDGAAYEQSQLLELRRRLLRLGYFSSALVLPDLDGRSDDSIPLRVELTAAPRHSYEVGVGFSTDTRQRLSLSWRSPRLNNRGHSQETVLRWSPVNPQARVTYSIPLDDPANDVLQLIGRLENNEFGDLDSRQREFALRRERTSGANVNAVQLRQLREDWSVFGNNFDADFTLAGISRSQRQRRGNAVDPRSGISQFYSVEGASDSLGSDEDLLRLYGSVTGLQRFGTHWRAVARAEVGMLWTSSGRPNELPPSLAFFAGGDRSIRGFAYQSVGRELSASEFLRDTEAEGTPPSSLVVGGTRLVTGSLELQRYFGENWRGALFVDAGDAFIDSAFEAKVGVGFGVHYLSPVGALRFELANPVSESGGSWRVHINIGAEF